MLQVGDEIAGHRIESQLGERPGATLWRLQVLRTGQSRVALLFDGGGPELRERALLELRSQAKVTHPNLVRAVDVLEAGSDTALLFDLGDAPDLGEWLRRGHQEIADIDTLFLGVLAGLEHAHDHGLVHGELRPEYIVVEIGGQGPVARLCALGVGRIIGGPPLSRSGLKPPLYLAPEQLLDNQRVDHRADIFALGCLLYEMIGGTPAFGGTDTYAVVGRILSEGYVLPEQLRSALPARYGEVIRRCLHSDRDRRYATCAQVRNAWNSSSPVAPSPVVAKLPSLAPSPRPEPGPNTAAPARPHGPAAPTPVIVEPEPLASPRGAAPGAPTPGLRPPGGAKKEAAEQSRGETPPATGTNAVPRGTPWAWIALIVALGALGFALMLLVGAGWWWSSQQGGDEKVATAPPVVREDTATAAGNATPPPAVATETQAAAPPKRAATPPASAAKTAEPKPTAPEGGIKPATEDEAPPVSAGAMAPLTLAFVGQTLPVTVELTCADGLRERASLQDGGVVFPSVPTTGQCRIHPKGGFAATTYAVNGGQSLTCTLKGSTTTCR